MAAPKRTDILTNNRKLFSLYNTGSDKIYYCAHRGTSMNPTLSKQDLLEIAAYRGGKPVIGDVALFIPPGGEDYCVHRIVGSGPEGFLARGDSNNNIDPWVLSEKDIHGRIIAAYKANRRRTIAGGFTGRMTGYSCFVRRKTNWLITQLLGPVYRSLCTGGILRSLNPVRFTPQVAVFRSQTNDSYNLLLGKRIIGFYDESLLKWQIKRPYRLFVDENSLPAPR